MAIDRGKICKGPSLPVNLQLLAIIWGILACHLQIVDTWTESRNWVNPYGV